MRAGGAAALLLAVLLPLACGENAGGGEMEAGREGGTLRLEPLFVVDSLPEPASVAWDGARRRWLITNRGGERRGTGGAPERAGFVTAVSERGDTVRKRAYGAPGSGPPLEAPAGIAVRGDRAVIADRERVVGLDLSSDDAGFTLAIPGSDSLVDVAFAEDGSILVADAGIDAVFRVAPDGTRHERWPAWGSLRSPRAVLYEGPDRALLLAAGEGAVVGLNPDSSVTLLAESPDLRQVAGIQRAPDGRLLATDGETGRLHAIGRDRERVWRRTEVLLSGLRRPADLLVVDSILALPEAGAHRVSFYRIRPQQPEAARRGPGAGRRAGATGRARASGRSGAGGG